MKSLIKKLLVIAGFAVGAAHAGLVGHTVTCEQLGSASSYVCSQPSAVVGASVEFKVGNVANMGWNFDFTDDQLIATSLFSQSLAETILQFSDLTLAFTSAIFGGQTGIVGLEESDISLTAGDLVIDLRNTSIQGGATFSIRLATAAQAEVPEPGSLALLGLGLVGLAAVRKRKQT